MELLSASSRLAPFRPRCLRTRVLSRRVPRRGAFRRVKQSAPLLRATPENAFEVPDYSVPQAADVSVVDGLLGEAFDKTLYVEKDAEELKTPLTQPSTLLHAEVVTDSPSFSLVRTTPALDKRSQTRRLLAEILAIALPALGTVLADPLMSLVDTACVGQISAVQLAALGPNTSIFNMVFAVFGVLGAALANRMASQSLKTPGLTRDEKTKRREQNETVLSHTLIIAVATGTVVTAILLAFGPTLLRWLGTTPNVMTAALNYLYIRAIATPAVLFIAASQGACLGQQDMWTPMKVVMTAGVINLVGDVALIMFVGLGTIGAAVATAAAQIAGALYFFHYLRKGGTNGKAVQLKWKGLPKLMSLKPIFEMGRVLASRNCLLMLAYCGMTAVAMTTGTVTLAAHQVALQLFWFLGYIPEPLSLTAQSLLARDQSNKSKVRSISEVLVKFGAGSGMLLAAIFGTVLLLLPRCFTSDPSVIAAFQRVVPHGMMGLFLCSVSLMFDGICIGTGHFQHLPGILYISTSITLGYLWLTQRLNLGLSGIWMSLGVFFASRALLHVTHLVRNWKLSPFSTLSPSLEPQLAVN